MPKKPWSFENGMQPSSPQPMYKISKDLKKSLESPFWFNPIGIYKPICFVSRHEVSSRDEFADFVGKVEDGEGLGNYFVGAEALDVAGGQLRG